MWPVEAHASFEAPPEVRWSPLGSPGAAPRGTTVRPTGLPAAAAAMSIMGGTTHGNYGSGNDDRVPPADVELPAIINHSMCGEDDGEKEEEDL